MKVVKIACRRKWQQILLENGFLEYKKNAKDEKLKSWNYLRIEILKIIWKLKFGKVIFLNQRWSNGRRTCGPKVAMQTMQSGILNLGHLEH